jgi:hypothetical protein
MKTMEITTSKTGQRMLAKPAIELLINEYFSELELEEALLPHLCEIGSEIGAGRLMVIGCQIVLRSAGTTRGGLTVDVLLLEDTARLYVLELKIEADKQSVVQAFNYSAQLRKTDAETIAGFHAAHLNAQGAVSTPEEALEQLAEFCDMTSEELLDNIQSESPAVVVITPEVSAEELAAAEALTEDGNKVVILVAAVHEHGSRALFNLERFFPALDPVTDRRRRPRRHAHKIAESPDGTPETSTDSMIVILRSVKEVGDRKESISLTDLRKTTGLHGDFTPTYRHLREFGLIITKTERTAGRGRNPELVLITEAGCQYLAGSDVPTGAESQTEDAQ